MARGGRRVGAGRKKGGTNKLDQEARERVLAGSDESPLDFLLRVMRTSADEARALDAAKAAAPYVHAKLSSVDLGNKDGKPFRTEYRLANSPKEAIRDPSRE